MNLTEHLRVYEKIYNLPDEGTVIEIDENLKTNDSWLRFVQSNCLENILSSYRRIYYLSMQFLTMLSVLQRGDEVSYVYAQINSIFDVSTNVLFLILEFL